MDSELDMTVDEETWIEEHQVYCPVPWCCARTLRRSRCGDVNGPYEGLHVARIEYAKGEAKRVQRQLASLRKMGVKDPEMSLGFARLMQDGVDTGLLLHGRKGRRKLV